MRPGLDTAAALWVEWAVPSPEGRFMDVRFRAYLAELFGTFLVVVFGAGTLCAGYLPDGDSRFTSAGGLAVAVALAQGLTLAAVVTATMHLSPTCCNPAVTLALWVAKKVDGTRTALLIAVQFLGALAAGLLVRGLFREDVLAAARMGSPHLKGLVGPDGVTLSGMLTGAGVELLLTAVVVLAVFATLIDPRAPKLGGVVVGLAQVAAVLFGFHLTGGAGNPAMWVGTAPWQLTLSQLPVARPLDEHFVYWGGPVVGALAAGLFYTFVILPGDRT